jgi:hypothetical protein
MRTILAGSRSGFSAADVEAAWDACGWSPSVVLCGMAPGVDALGASLALARGVRIEYFPADWERLGKAAGPVRNRKMASAAEAAILLWDGNSLGTKNMLFLASTYGLRIHLVRRGEERQAEMSC